MAKVFYYKNDFWFHKAYLTLNKASRDLLQCFLTELDRVRRKNKRNEWIITNPDMLNSKYGIISVDVRREIQLRNKERKIDDDLDQIINFFKRVKSIDIDRLAEKLVMSSKTLMDIFDEYGDNLEQKGLNFGIEGNLIVKY